MTLEVPAGDSLAIAANFYLAESYFGSRNQLQAARQFRKVSDDFPTSPLSAEALLRAGDAYADLWRRPEPDDSDAQTAKATYQELLNRYPDAPPAARARMRIADLEEWFAVKEYKAAQYYLRLKAYDSANLYLKDIAATYPRASLTPTALLRLVDAYRSLGYAEDRRETSGYIRRFHPTTPGLEAACPAPRDSAAAPWWCRQGPPWRSPRDDRRKAAARAAIMPGLILQFVGDLFLGPLRPQRRPQDAKRPLGNPDAAGNLGDLLTIFDNPQVLHQVGRGHQLGLGTRRRVASVTVPVPFSTYETVAVDTSASSATCLFVAMALKRLGCESIKW